MPALSGRECGLRGRTAHKRRGNLRFPLLLRITTLSYRARCARKDKCRFPIAARLFGQGKQNRCHPKGAGARCAPLREGNRNAPVVWNLPFLLLGVSGRQVERGTCFCARSAPLFAAANAANLRVETYTSAPAQRKRGDSQEGRNFVSPLLCACGAQPRICRYDLAYTARRGRESGQFAAPSRRALRNCAAIHLLAPYGEVLQAASYSRARNARPYDKADI